MPLYSQQVVLVSKEYNDSVAIDLPVGLSWFQMVRPWSVLSSKDSKGKKMHLQHLFAH
jgi:hypothetical protein